MEYGDVVAEFKNKYVALYKKAEKLGYNAEELVFRGKLTDDDDPSSSSSKKGNSKNINCKKSKSVKLKTSFYLLIGFVILLLSRLFSKDLYPSFENALSIVAETFQIRDAIRFDQCIIPLPSVLTPFFLPPSNCSLCRGLKTLDKVHGISRERFESLYAYTGRPVVITDAMKNWTALDTFGFDFFASLYSEDGLERIGSSARCQFFPYKTRFQHLSEVFERREQLLEGDEPWYIGWGNCDLDAADILRGHYSVPYFLPEGSESSRVDWIFMGSPGYGAHMHLDKVGDPSWQAQVSGSKLWTLVPPQECYFECQDSIEVVVKKGEIIVLDTNQWYHSTLIIGDGMSITIGSEYD